MDSDDLTGEDLPDKFKDGRPTHEVVAIKEEHTRRGLLIFMGVAWVVLLALQLTLPSVLSTDTWLKTATGLGLAAQAVGSLAGGLAGYYFQRKD